MLFLIKYYEFYVYKEKVAKHSILYLYLICGGLFERCLRVIFGEYVIDYISIAHSWGRITFDLADLCLSVGTILLVLSYMIYSQRIRGERKNLREYIKEELEFHREFILYLKKNKN